MSLGAGMDTHEGATARGFGGHQGEKNVSVRGGPSARASRQERSALLAQQAGAVNEVATSVSGFLERMDGGVGQGCVVPVKADLSVEGKGAGGSCSRRASLACGNLRSSWILEGGADHPCEDAWNVCCCC
ncbi:unnamed protein product [Ectocarpus sp. 6 AP-2014]